MIYKAELIVGLTEAWKLAREHVLRAQRHQKILKFYGHHSRRTTCQIDDRVCVLLPAAKTGKAHKFAKLVC